MGDVAMTVPVLHQLLEAYPELRVTVVSKPFFKPIFFTLPRVEFVAAEVTKNHSGFLGLFRLFKELNKQQITHVADVHNVLRSRVISLFFKIAGVKVVRINKGRWEKKQLTKESVKKIKPLKSTHQRYADVLYKLGFQIQLNTLKRVKLPLKAEVMKKMGKSVKPWIGVAPFAAFEGKVYPEERMQKVIQELVKMNCSIFLFGGPQELEKLNILRSGNNNVFVTPSQFTFEEELLLISNLDLMISMDSGNGHLAAMYGVDVITVWGVTHPYAGFTPYNQPLENQITPDLEKYPLLPCSVYGNKVFSGYQKVMEDIEPELIVERARQVLQKKSLKSS